MSHEVLVAIVVTLIVNEATDVSPWTAIRLVRWASKHIYAANPDRVTKRAEEWEALIAKSIPTNISKFCFGLSLGAAALSCISVRRANAALSVAKRATESIHLRLWPGLIWPLASVSASLVNLGVISALLVTLRLRTVIALPLMGLAALNSVTPVLVVISALFG